MKLMNKSFYKKSRISKKSAYAAGFTRVEVAIVIGIFGLLTVAAIQYAMPLFTRAREIETMEKMARIERAVAAYAVKNMRVPCPAVPNRGTTNPPYGFERGSGANGDQIGSCAGAANATGLVPFATLGLSEDDVIDGYPVKKGEVVLFSVLGLHTNPKLWDEPLRFKPERFLENSEATRKYFHPFGAGPRMCIGNHFAMMEITIVLAKMVAHFDFKLVQGQQIEAQPLVTLKPKYGIQLEIQ